MSGNQTFKLLNYLLDQFFETLTLETTQIDWQQKFQVPLLLKQTHFTCLLYSHSIRANYVNKFNSYLSQ
jgi:hypothetical protein